MSGIQLHNNPSFIVIQTTYSQEQIHSAIVYALGKLGVENLKNKWLEAVETFVNSSDTFELVDGSTASTLPPFPLGHNPSSMYYIYPTNAELYIYTQCIRFCLLQGR